MASIMFERMRGQKKCGISFGGTQNKLKNQCNGLGMIIRNHRERFPDVNIHLRASRIALASVHGMTKSLKSRPVVQNRHKKALHRLALTRRLLDPSVGQEPHDGYKYVAAVSRLRPNERERYRDQVDDDTGKPFAVLSNRRRQT
jgi:hypothetical protein